MRKPFQFICICFMLFSCGEEGVNNELLEEQLFDATSTLFDAVEKMDELVGTEAVDPVDALFLVRDFISSNDPTVSNVFVLDSTYLDIETEGGFRTQVFVDRVDEEGISLYRGSPTGQTASFSNLSGNCGSTITNKKVLLYGAAVEDFYPGTQYQTTVVDYLKNSDQNLEVTTLTGALCSPNVLSTFDQYGLVILDTHGMPDAFQSGLKFPFNSLQPFMTDRNAFKNELITRFGNANYQRLLKSEMRYIMKVKKETEIAPGANLTEGNIVLAITSKSVRNLVPQLPETIVFGNMCYSGWNATTDRAGFPLTNGFTGPMRAAFMGKNPISYYAFSAGDQTDYSYVVPVNFSNIVQRNMLDRLVYDGDCTGESALYSDGTDPFVPFNPEVLKTEINLGALLFKHYGKNDYGYFDCGTFKDPRDQREYQLACVGNQVWFAENLQYAGAGLCYENIGANCENEGRLYSIQELTGLETSFNSDPVRGLCPEGWRVPSKTDYINLINALGGQGVAEAKLGDPSAWPSEFEFNNESGFSLKPSRNGLYDGYTDNQQEWEDPSDILDLAGDTRLWTSTKQPGALSETDFDIFILNAEPFSNEINSFYGSSYPGYPGMYRQFPCRCVRDL